MFNEINDLEPSSIPEFIRINTTRIEELNQNIFQTTTRRAVKKIRQLLNQ
jgi:hypothetical protein